MPQGVDWPCAFPGYLDATFDMFCSIAAQARWEALPPVRCPGAWSERLCLLKSRGSLALDVVVALLDDAACRWGVCLWSPVLCEGVDRSCLRALDSTTSRRRAALELGLRRAFSLANSSGCCVAMCALKPAA